MILTPFRSLLGYSFVVLLFTSVGSVHAEPRVEYRVAADARVIDKITNPLSRTNFIGQPQSSGQALKAADAGEVGANRSFGLSRLQISARFNASENSFFSLVLRPDAGLNSTNALGGSDFDSRAGAQPKIEIQDRQNEIYIPRYQQADLTLLDAYSFVYRPGSDINIALGVFEYLAMQTRAYEPMLDFGGAVWFPRKFAGFILSGSRHDQLPVLPQRQLPTGLSYQLAIFEGANDRAGFSATAESKQSFDRAPEGKDAYKGVAVNTVYRFSSAYSLGVTFGSNTRKENFGDLSGKLNDAFLGIAQTVGFQLLERQMTIALDLRGEETRGHFEALAYPTLKQMSAEVTTAYYLGTNFSTTMGLHWGQGENVLLNDLSQKIEIGGWQASMGLAYILSDVLKFRAEFAHERRLTTFDNLRVGSFISDDGDRQNTVKRFAIGIDYFAAGNI